MNNSKLRLPAVAGQFYPGTPAGIRKQIAGFLKEKAQPRETLGCILPHAGYIYSGEVAALTVQQLKVKNTVLMFGPNHTGQGAPFSVMSEGRWQTPMGEVRIDSHLAESLISACPLLEPDTVAHAYEHSLEVELPILQYFNPSFEIVPIAFLTREINALKTVGANIAHCLKKQGLAHSVLMVASSDMTHYEPKKSAEKKDSLAIEAILALDEDRLAEEVSRHSISMCGVAPVVVLLAAAKALGAKSGTLVKYQTSAETSGDSSRVVGYAGILIN